MLSSSKNFHHVHTFINMYIYIEVHLKRESEIALTHDINLSIIKKIMIQVTFFNSFFKNNMSI